MIQLHKSQNPVNQLPFDFLFSGKTVTINKSVSKQFSPSFAAALHELVWRADRNDGVAIISADELADELSISVRAARKILKDLKSSGLVISKRGSPVSSYTFDHNVSRETFGESEDSSRSLPPFYYTDRHLTVPKWLLEELSIPEAAVFSELVWFYRRLLIGKKIRQGQSFYRSFYDVGLEIGLSEDQVYRAVKKLRGKGLLSSERMGYSRKCHFQLSEERSGELMELHKTRQQTTQNAALIDTFRGTITILNNTNKNKSSDFRDLDHQGFKSTNKSLPSSAHLQGSNITDWDLPGRAEPELYVVEDGDEAEIYVSSIPGIALEGSRKYTVREYSILKNVGEIYLAEMGESFRFGNGGFDREDLSAIGKFSLGEIRVIAYNCIEAWRKKLPGFRKYPPHLRTMAARLGILTTESISEMETRAEHNRSMKKIRESGKKVEGKKKYFPGQYYPELMDPNSEWG